MQLGPISGPSSPCINTDLTFSINPVPGATYYNWSVLSMPPGASYPIFSNATTNHPAIKFTTAGTYTISTYAASSYCQSNIQSLTVNVSTGSTWQGFLSGPANLCFGLNGTFTSFADPINPVPSNTNFNWWSYDAVTFSDITTVPSIIPIPPTNFTTYKSVALIDFSTPGNKTILTNYTVPGGCTSPTSLINVFIDQPQIPTIVGEISPLCNTTNTYYTTGGNSNFLWIVPPGGTLISGGTPNDYSITIRWNDSSPQNLKVNYKDIYGCMQGVFGSLTVTPSKRSQNLSLIDPYYTQFGNAPISFPTNTNLGLPVTYSSSNTNVATTSNNQITIVGVGTSTITATQPGDGCTLPLSNSTASLVVNKGNQFITFNTLSPICQLTTANLGATSTSGLPITYTSSNPGIVTISGNIATAIASGIVSISASQPGNANYNAASSIGRSLTVYAIPNNLISASGPLNFCPGGSVTLTSSSGTSYLWSTGATTQSIVASTGGSYSVTVTNSNGCSATSTPTTVTINSLPVATITPGGSTTFCSGGSVTLTSSAGSSYSWSTGETTQSIVASSSGNYTVTVTNGSGCSTTSLATTITVNPLPTSTITPSGPTSICSGSSVTLTASSGTSYVWSTGATSQAISVSLGGNYSVTITNSNGCSSISSPSTVTLNTNPTITISGPTAACGAATLTANGGTSYSWSGPGIGGDGNSKTAYYTGWYYVTGYNASGCFNNASMYVTINPTPSISISGSSSGCSSVKLTANGGSSYSWSGPGVSGGETSKWVYYTGWYYLTGYNASGCYNTASLYVTISPRPTVSIYKSNGNICSGYVSITASATAGSSYYWPAAYPYAASSSATVLIKSGQTRTVTVTLNGCSASDSYYAGYCSGGGGSGGGGGGGGGGHEPRIATYSEEVVSEPNAENELSGIFPNPVDKELNVVLEKPVEFFAEIKLGELSGKILASQSLSKGEYKTHINTEGIPDGIYILAILSDSKKKYMKVVVRHAK